MRSTAELVCVDPKRVHEIWPHVSAAAESGLPPHRAQRLCGYRSRHSRRAQPAVAGLAANGPPIEAAAATILINSDVGKVCIITVCGGRDMTRWLPLIAGIEAYAKREGCSRVRIFGRKGWLRVLDGYRAKHVVADKKFS